MTHIAFHFGAPDRLAYTCRLLRKATATGARLQVLVPQGSVAALDAALWNLGPTEFISHCDASAATEVRKRSAVLLLEGGAALDSRFPMVVNLAAEVPQGFEQFQRVIEIVSTDAQERAQARLRWRHYTERGYTIDRHDLQGRAVES